MMSRRMVSAALGSVLLAGALPALAADPNATLRVKLQSFLQVHVDRLLVDGAFLWLDLSTGEVRKLYPTTPHPMIMVFGAHCVLCSEFRDSAGKPVEMDFYTAVRGNGHVVFRTEVANRAPLMALMDKGKVQRL
ncbi:hypothetical protein [Sphaerotilus sp.]|uniref:hypothetical protein n=1 Tax=Sphaerotilus sp. TaxID=2093942 RepID=UPI002ACD739F|nr:hypothetical protein [Sphaerotilus sp.]